MPDRREMAGLMTKRLSRPMMAFLIASGVIGASHDVQVYLVGGMVRDLLLDRPTRDPDLLVQQTVPVIDAASRYGALLAAGLRGSVSPPSQFATVKVEAGGLDIDIATARRETYASPGALPAVRPATIERDTARRDFTVNAIAVDLSPKTFGAVVDLHGGVADLERGVLATLHDASFRDDPTRLFRAVRYETRLDLRMSMLTEAALRRDVGYIGELSGDRVRHELERLFQEAAPEAALSRAEDFGLLRAVLPSLAWTAAMSAAARALGEGGPLDCLALLASRLSREDAGALIARVNAPRAWAEVIEDTVALRERLPEIGGEGTTSPGVHAALEAASVEAVRAWAALTSDEVTADRLRDYLDRLRHVRPELTGDDLLALGVPPGPRVGELLRELLVARLNGAAASRADEEAIVRRGLSTQVE